MAARLFSTPEVATLTGFTFRMLDGYARDRRCVALWPTYQSQGSGHARRYTAADVERLLRAAALLQAMAPIVHGTHGPSPQFLAQFVEDTEGVPAPWTVPLPNGSKLLVAETTGGA